MKFILNCIFILLCTISDVHARANSTALTWTAFCKNLATLTNSQEKDEFITKNFNELITSPTALNLVPSSKNYLKELYQKDEILRANLYNKLLDVQEAQKCRDILANAFSVDRKEMMQELDLTQQQIYDSIAKKHSQNDSSSSYVTKSQQSDCSTDTICSPVPPLLNPNSGFNQVIESAATAFPQVLIGMYNQSCDCSKSKDVGKRTNAKEKKLAREFIAKELMRKKLYKLIDFNEKKLFADSYLGEKNGDFGHLGCDKDSLEESLAKECNNKNINSKLLTDSLMQIIKDNPKIQEIEKINSFALMESSIAKAAKVIKSCNNMNYENYAHLVKNDMLLKTDSFFKLYKTIAPEIPEKSDGEGELGNDVYINSFLKTIENPQRRAYILNLLKLDPSTNEVDIVKQFKIMHETYSTNLALKTLLGNPSFLRNELLNDNNTESLKMIKHGLEKSLNKKNCQNIIKEIASVACVDIDEVDFTKYDIDLDHLVSLNPNAITPDLINGLCLIRRKIDKDVSFRGVSYQTLGLESQPDIIKFLQNSSEPGQTNGPVMEVYGKNFCSRNTQLEQNVEQEQQTLNDIRTNPSHYSHFISVDNFLSAKVSSVSFFTEKSKSPQNDNSRDHFARTNRNSQSYQSNVNFNSNQTKRLGFTDYSSSLNTRSIQGQTKSTISAISNPTDESTKNQVVDQYRELDENDDDYFAKRKELLKQLYASSENTTTSSNLSSNDYLTKIKELEEKLQQNENLLKQAGGEASDKNNESINNNQQNLVTSSSVSQLSGANQSKVNTNVNESSSTNTNSSKSSVITGGDVSVGENSSNAILASKNARSDGLYLSLSNSDFENVKFIKNVEGQIKELAQTNMDYLVQLLEKGQLVVEIDGKKINIKNDDLNKILDPITLNMIQMKLSEKKSSPLIKNKKQQVESEVKQIKSQMYNTLLQLSKRLKSEGKI
jgi:hypothetical protein